MKNLKELAQEALNVQDASNLSGVVHAFSRAMTDLRGNLPNASTEALNHHPVSVLFADKIAHLTGTQKFGHPTISKAYREIYKILET